MRAPAGNLPSVWLVPARRSCIRRTTPFLCNDLKQQLCKAMNKQASNAEPTWTTWGSSKGSVFFFLFLPTGDCVSSWFRPSCTFSAFLKKHTHSTLLSSALGLILQGSLSQRNQRSCLFSSLSSFSLLLLCQPNPPRCVTAFISYFLTGKDLQPVVGLLFFPLLILSSVLLLLLLLPALC